MAGRSRHQGPPRIAVLPFENLGAAEDEFFADGVADEVRTKLASLPGVIVTARGSAAQYKKSSKTPREIGRDLQVDYLLTGTVRWSKTGGASKVRVTPELTRVSDMPSRWSEQIDADLADVFKVQSNIATTVASKLDVALAAAERTIGRWDASLAHLLEARKIDPRNVRTARILGSQYHQMRRYDAALAAWYDALALAPDNLAIIQGAADTWLALGRLDSARAVVNRALTIVDTARLAEHFALYQEQMWVLPEAVQPVVTRLTIKDFDGDRGHFGLKIGGTWKLLGNMDKARAYATRPARRSRRN